MKEKGPKSKIIPINIICKQSLSKKKVLFFIPEPQKASAATAHSHFHGDKLFIKVNGHESH